MGGDKTNTIVGEVCMRTASLLRSTRKTECGAVRFPLRLAVRAAPFALHVLAALGLTAAMSFAQTATKNWTPPKTSWGDPDLEGTWTSDDQYGVPFERPVKFGTRKTLTEQELAERVKEDELLQTSIEAGERPNAGYWKNQKGVD